MNVDVVIALYNGSKWIGKTLESVFSQSLKPNKIIVVDDGSSDGSNEIVSNYSNIILLQNTGKGPAAARNLGLQHTSSALVAFLDQDDIWHHEHLQILSETLTRNSDIDIAASSCSPFRDGSRYSFDLSDTSSELIDPWEYYVTHVLACAPSLSLFRRGAIIKCGGWDVNYTGVSDYSLWLKMSVSKPVVRIKAKTLAYRTHDSSHSVTLRNDPFGYIRLITNTEDYLMEYFIQCAPDSERKKIVVRRNKMAHHLHNMFLAFTNDDDSVFSDEILKLELIFIEEKGSYQKCLLLHFYYLLADSFSKGYNRRILRSICVKLINKWPKEAHTTQNILLFILANNGAISAIAVTWFSKNVPRIYSVQLLFTSLGNKLFRKLNHLLVANRSNG